MTTRTDTRAPAPHAADRHDLIRVHGARENNLQNVNIEIPKRRLTSPARARARWCSAR
jgi:excinuclease UvrABC ATPase subunit